MRQKRIQGSHFANLKQASAANKFVIERRIDPCMSEVFPWDQIPVAHTKMWKNQHAPGNMAVLVDAPAHGVADVRGRAGGGGQLKPAGIALCSADPLGRTRALLSAHPWRSVDLALDPGTLKRLAAEKALELRAPRHEARARHRLDGGAVRRRAGVKVKAGLDIVGVPTSEATRRQAEALGIELTTLDETPELDLTIDGADELDARAQPHQGRRRRAAARKDRRGLVEADDRDRRRLEARRAARRVSAARRSRARSGSARRACRLAAAARALGLSGEIRLRERDGHVFVTDGGHYILDCAFGAIPSPASVSPSAGALPGVVDHGLFIGLASAAIVAGANGVEILEPKTA